MADSPIINELSGKVIGTAIEVHKILGPGLLEAVYEHAMAHEMTLRGIQFERQKPLNVFYKGKSLDVGYRLDFLVEDLIIVELKAVERFHDIHKAQLLNYLKLADKKLGLLLNFNVVLMKHGGIKRLALNL